MKEFDPIESLADMRHEFGEHGGVNMSIETRTTFTVMDAGTMPEIFQGHRGPDDGGCFLYGRHFNPTVYVLGHQIAALGTTGRGAGTYGGRQDRFGQALEPIRRTACDPAGVSRKQSSFSTST